MTTTHSQLRVAIIVLNWNNWHETIACLESLRGVTSPRWQAVVVDNGSTDDSVAQIRAWAEQCGWPVVDAAGDDGCGLGPLALLSTERNLGYTGGNNAGIRHA